MKTCPFCAEEIQDAAIVCKHCRRDLPRAAAATTPSTTARGSKRVIQTMVAAAALGILAVLFFGSSGDDARPVESESTEMTAERLAAIIRGADFACEDPTRFERQGEKDGGVFWNTTCSNGKSYAVSVNAAGSTRIFECEVLRRVVGVECFAPLK